MTPGKYTELFFLDEATALAAGHRPCAECQRERFNLFRETWAKANPELAIIPRPAATTLDAILHQERLAESSQAHRFCNSIENLPDGAFVTDDAKKPSWFEKINCSIGIQPGINSSRLAASAFQCEF
jgi:methylphosphotriester-DNA--protein-cysteine methyltransferase